MPAISSLSTSKGFAPIVANSPRGLILGSMPSKVSLDLQQYYAHSRNAFWPIMARLLNFDCALPYADRCTLLQESGLAVWDVLQTCHRPGSLDADIDNTSLVLNNFSAFLEQYTSISMIFFNGAKAESLFQKVLPSLTNIKRSSLTLQRLPSTSPAHAAMSFELKLVQWQKALAPLRW